MLAYGKPEIREIIADLAFLFIKIDRIPQPVESLLAERL
jgi:hypothetical protein